jgi:conjugative transfer signal peptidase TraF
MSGDRGDPARRKLIVQRDYGRRVLPIFIATAVACISVATASVVKPKPLFIWNVTASAPRGLYRLHPGALPVVGQRVVSALPWRVRKLAERRNYLPLNVPVVKRVAAASGDRICGERNAVFVNDRLVALRNRTDPRGRKLPRWQGCVTLRPNDYFLLGDGARSFDGRYFGVTRATDIIGTAEFLWPR